MAISTDPNPLIGRWFQPCSKGAVKSEYFRRFEVALTEMYFLDKNCRQPSLILINEGSYWLPVGNHIDFQFASIRARLMSAIAINDFNRRKVCGFDDWQLGSEKEISGRSCEIFYVGIPQRLPTVGEMRYGIYQLREDRLSFGKLSRDKDATTPDKRPTEFNSRFYTRAPHIRP